jgi:hypothetical protein
MPPLEVLVVDDHSSDGTRLIAERSGFRVIAAEQRPKGWRGKPWAAWQAAQVAQGDWLLFVDADVELSAAALRAAVAVAEQRSVGLLTVMPKAESASTWESLFLPTLAILIFAFLDPRLVDNPKRKHVAVSGAFLLVRRDAYETVGGHAAVHDQVMEDYELALAIKSRGMPICLVNAAHLVRVRRRQSFRELWNQWCRVCGGGLAGQKWLALCGALYVAVVFSGPPAVAVWSLVAGAPTAWVLLSAGFALIHMGGLLAVGRMLGMEARFMVLQPIGALFTVAALARAAISPAGASRIRWRGRELNV